MAAMYSTGVYIFGFVGLVAITLIPLRTWHLSRKYVAHRAPNTPIVFALLVGLLASLALIAHLQVVVRVFYCLTGGYCGPSIAHGWLYLAMLGVAYLAFESFVAVVSAVARAGSRGAT